MQLLKFTEKPSACSLEMEWRRIPEFSRFFVSEYGDVVSASRNKRMKGFIDYDGYPAFKLTGDDGKKHQVSSHRLVALAFLGNEPTHKSQIRHLNGSRLHAHYTNLAWGNAFENRKDTRKHGTSPTKGERNSKAKLSNADIRRIRKIHRDIKEGRTDMRVYQLAENYGVHIATICNIASGKAWPHVE